MTSLSASAPAQAQAPAPKASLSAPIPTTSESSRLVSLKPTVSGSTFRTPLVPLIDDVLEVIHSIAEGTDSGTGTELVIEKIKEITAHIKNMRTAALALPGGDMTTEQVEELVRSLQAQAEERRETLTRFAAVPTPIADSIPVSDQEDPIDSPE